MATKKFDPNERTIDVDAEGGGIKVSIKFSPAELAEVLRCATEEERRAVVYDLICDGKDIWKLAQEEVKDSGAWHEWERPKE